MGKNIIPLTNVTVAESKKREPNQPTKRNKKRQRRGEKGDKTEKNREESVQFSPPQQNVWQTEHLSDLQV